jgi:thiol:disulfide interchange protein DsbD
MDFQAALGHGVFFAYLAVFVGGLLTAATPCVFPLIPITVSIFGARAATRKLEAALLSGLYVFGIAIMYTALGLGAAATGSAFGRVMANPWVIGFVAAVFVLFAASMLGAFEIALPASLQARLTQVGGRGLGGALAMGLVAGIIAAPCTGPVLGAVLTYVATTQKLVFGGSLLFVYAIGMGLPFFLVGTFAIALPKSGPWMDGVKSVFGIVMLVAALYFLKDVAPVLKRYVPTGRGFQVGAAAAVLVGVALGAVHRSSHGSIGERTLKFLGVALVVVGAHAVIVGQTKGLPGLTEGEWAARGATVLAQARTQHKPVVIDFGADWCPACKELELITYPHPQVAQELKRFVFIKIDDDHGTVNPQFGGNGGLPLVVFFDSEGRQLKERSLQGFLKPSEFLEILRQVN